MKAALIDSRSKEIVNIIELPDDYDSAAEGAYSPPENQVIVIDPESKAEIGGFFINGAWEKSPVLEPDAPVVDVQTEKMHSLVDILVEKGVINQTEAEEVKGIATP